MDEITIKKINALVAKHFDGRTRTDFCNACGFSIELFSNWIRRGMPASEWTGKTQHAAKIAEVLQHEISPLEICPGAGQYMAAKEAA